MSQIYHNIYSNRLIRGHYRDKERPVLINNWEATYFDFNEEKIKGKEVVRNQIKLYKEIRNIVQFGDFYRLQSPFEENHVSWMTMSKDKK